MINVDYGDVWRGVAQPAQESTGLLELHRLSCSHSPSHIFFCLCLCLCLCLGLFLPSLLSFLYLFPFLVLFLVLMGSDVRVIILGTFWHSEI